MKRILLLAVGLLSSACALFDGPGSKKPAPVGLIATPASYYSTAKAKYLAARYKDNLDRIIERIVRNPKTSSLQFANNISSVGGIGFFTHSATKTPDERYLEVVLATPETFESQADVSEKVHQLFSRYGGELLGIVIGDADIYRDKELRGYGLNLAWRDVVAEPAGNRIALARAIIYFPKERALSFLRKEISQNELLAEAVIFAVNEDGPLNLVSYKPQTLRAEIRPAIREDDLTGLSSAAPEPEPKETAKKAEEKAEQKIAIAGSDPAPAAGAKPSPQEIKAEAKKAGTGAQTSAAKATEPKTAREPAPQKTAAAQVKETERASSEKETKGDRIKETIIAEAEAKAKAGALKPAAKAPASAAAPAVKKPATEAVAEKPSEAAMTRPPAAPENKVAPGEIAQPAKEISPLPAAQPVAPAEKPPVVSKPSIQVTKRDPFLSDATRRAAESLKTETKASGGPGGNVVSKPAEKPPVVEQKKDDPKAATAPASMGKAEAPAQPAAQSENKRVPLAKASPVKEPAPPVEKAVEPVAARGIAPTTPAAPAPAQAAKQEAAPATAQTKSKVEEKTTAAPEGESAAVEAAMVAPEKSDAKTRDAAPDQGPALKAPTPRAALQEVQPAPSPSIAKAEAPHVETKPVAPPVITKPAAIEEPKRETIAQAKPQESTTEKAVAPQDAGTPPPSVPSKPVAPPVAAKSRASAPEEPKKEQVTLLHKPGAPMAEKTAPAKPVIQPSPEPAKPAPAAELPKGPPAPEMARKETRPVEIKPSAPVAAAEEKTAAEKSASGQVALLSKPRDPVIEKKPAVLPSIPKALEGFIIQLAFKDKDKARNWAEAMQRRGFAVSLTEAGAEGALRVRLGNFSAREDAERQLRSFKQDGLTGIIINLPQAYRPEARSSVP